MSNLRIIGLVIGVLGLLVTFLFYRGPKWKRSNFVLFALFNICLIAISANPDFVNFARNMLSMQEFQHGRLLALLIISTLFLLFYSFNTKSKLESIRIQFDKLIRNMGTADFLPEDKLSEKIKSIMVVIPAYNEEENLKELLQLMPRYIEGMQVGVLVIDDASEDDTKVVVSNYGHLVVSNKINRGQGAASRLGYDILIKYNVTVGVTMDGDNQHRPDDLKSVVAPILNGQYDLVIGSRILGKREKDVWIRNFGIILFSRIISLAMGVRVTDCSSGFKAFNIDKFKNMNLTEDQFQSAEVLIEARKKGLRIGEVPITINRRTHGQSKKGTDWNYGLNFAKTIIKTWWR